MPRLRSLALASAGVSLVSTCIAGNFADTVIDYNPGAGFAAGFTNASTSLGQPTATATPFSPAFRNTQLVSLGAGGSLTLQFNTPIQNDSSHPYGLDFTIFGNAGFVITNGNFSGGGITDGSLLGNNTGSTRVSVSRDNITYYQLNPALAPTVDGLFPTDGTGNFSLPVNPALTLGNFAGQNLAGIRSLYNGSAGGGSFDISWAEDALGNSIFLSDIDYVRIDVLSGKSEVDGISVVPEPNTWALLLTGLLLLGYQLRPRKFKIPNNSPKTHSTITPMKSFLFIFITIVAATRSIVSADTFTETFATNPASNGWQVFGDPSLFLWDRANHNIYVTWDSSRPNSYFHHPLPATLTKADDFSFAFDLLLNDAIAGINTNKPYTFELAIGLLNLTNNAAQTNFMRGAGIDPVNGPRNLVEFNYFPDDGLGDTATTGPTIVSSDNNFNFDGDTYPLALTIGDLFHVTLTYTASSRTFVTVVTRNGQPFGPINTATLGTNFDDFQVDRVAICNYSDVTPYPDYNGSILAHGRVDNFVVTTPPPVANIAASFSGPSPQVQFVSRTNWLYTLEKTVDLQSWLPASPATAGTGNPMTLQDTNAPAARAFYRVRAQQP